MDSPTDGDELARVVPLRRRDRELTATPAARGSLPRERAPFDPEIEPGDTPPHVFCAEGPGRTSGAPRSAGHGCRVSGPEDPQPRRGGTPALYS